MRRIKVYPKLTTLHFAQNSSKLQNSKPCIKPRIFHKFFKMFTKCIVLVTFVTLIAVHSAPVLDSNTLAIGEVCRSFSALTDFLHFQNEKMTIEMVNGSLIVKREVKIDQTAVSPTPLPVNTTTTVVDDVKSAPVKRHIVIVNETHVDSDGEETVGLISLIDS